MSKKLRRAVAMSAAASLSAASPLIVAASLMIALAGVAAPSATAYNHAHNYCAVWVYYGETCPPHEAPCCGGSWWEHLQENAAIEYKNEGTGIACIDEFLDPNNNGYYTGQTCAPYAEGVTRQYPGGTWGYPRAWSGSVGSHYLWAQEAWN
jgi:hypothetical protein